MIPCFCRDASEFLRRIDEAGFPRPPHYIEPEKTPFPSRWIENSLALTVPLTGMQWEQRHAFLTPAEFIDDYILSVWQGVRRGVQKSNGLGAPCNITWSDLTEYEKRIGYELHEWVVWLVLDFDDAFLSAYRPNGSES